MLDPLTEKFIKDCGNFKVTTGLADNITENLL